MTSSDAPAAEREDGKLSFRRGSNLFHRSLSKWTVATHTPHGSWKKALGNPCLALDVCPCEACPPPPPDSQAVYRQISLRGVCSWSPPPPISAGYL